jgi:hypothetical protein
MKPDGGPVYPTDEYYGEKRYAVTPGMSLRDFFAGQALAGFALACSIAQGEMLDGTRAAELSYAFADALLAEREKE